ncbi:uncharacterized protein LOC141537217 [Cotesia typhae]|uniref:uncharacterized protein LOC141537217 n=1 Tax=Cotesia typhae TaxID=2053667 RepID=UPI003D68DE80
MPKLNTSKNIENYCRSRQYTLRKRLKNSQIFNNNRKLWFVKRKEIIMKNLSNTDELSEEECDQSSTASEAEEEKFDIVEGDQNDFHNNDAVNEDYDGNRHDVNDSDNENDKIDDVVGDYDRENDEVSNNDDENNEIDDEIGDDEDDNDDHHDSDNSNNEFDDNDEINGEASDDDDLQSNVEENEENLPLYESSPITCSESMLSIFMYSIRHNLTGCALEDLLSLISLHLPPNSKHKKTVHTFMKHFNGSKAQLIKHYYCSQCLANLKTIESNCSCVVQPQNNCESDKVENRPEILYFIEVPLYHQLKELFLRSGFINDLSYPYRRQKINDDCIEDIYDGLLYKEHIAEFNPDHDIFNLTFMWYTDGAPVFKSRTYSVWPFYFIINELPYEKRILRENIILAGLWFGPSDPKVNTFLSTTLS